MLTRFKKKFLPKNRKYEIASGCPEHSQIEDVTLNRYETRSKSGSLGSNTSGSPNHTENTGVIWHNNTYDILPFQLDTISPKPSVRQNSNSLPSRRQAGEELPPLPLKARELNEIKKKPDEDEILLLDNCKTPSPTDSIYVTPRPFNQNKEVLADTYKKPQPPETVEKPNGHSKEDSEELLPPPSFRDCDEAVDEDKEFPSTWLRSPRVKSPNASVSTPSPTDSESKAEDASLTSDSNIIEKKPSLKKREKPSAGVKPPMMRPLRKKKPAPGPGAEKRDSRNSEKEDAPLPPSPAHKDEKDSKAGEQQRASQCSSTADRDSVASGQRDSGLSCSSGSVFENNMDGNKATSPTTATAGATAASDKKAENTGYTSFDELQNHLKMTALPAPPPAIVDEVVDSDEPFPPPPPPLAEVLSASTPRHIEVTEGEPQKQTIVRPRYKDGLLGYDGDEVDGHPPPPPSSTATVTVPAPASAPAPDSASTSGATSSTHLQEPASQNVQRNISHESGYETAGIDHSSSSEQIRDDVFPDPVEDLITENLYYSKEEQEELRKGPVYRDTTEVSLLSATAVRDMYAFVPKNTPVPSTTTTTTTSMPRSQSHQSDTSTDNYPESPENTGTSTSVSSPEDDGDRDTLKMSTELLLPAPVLEGNEGGEARLLDDDEEDYLPPIPTRNYQGGAENGKSKAPAATIKSSVIEDDDVEESLPPPPGEDMLSSLHSDISVESVCMSEPVHMSLDEVREQAKTLGVPLSVSNSNVNQSQPCITTTAKTRTMSDTSNNDTPVSPTSKHNTFPIDKSTTPTGTPKKHTGTGKKKPKLRIPNIFSRGKSSPEPPSRVSSTSSVASSTCEIHGTIQKRSLPAVPPHRSSSHHASSPSGTATSASEEDSDKTPVGSPAHHRASSTCQIHGTLATSTVRENGGRSSSSFPRNMPGRDWNTAPRARASNNTGKVTNKIILLLLRLLKFWVRYIVHFFQLFVIIHTFMFHDTCSPICLLLCSASLEIDSGKVVPARYYLLT